MGLRIMKVKIFGAAVALVLLSPLASLLLVQLVRRLGFIIRHGGMDCATCDGSPMAFLVAMVFEMGMMAAVGGSMFMLWRVLRVPSSRS